MIIDVRGEMCPVPAIRVEKHLKGAQEPFTVVGDHLPTIESLQLLAVRYGWKVEFVQDPSGDWKANFEPNPSD